MHRIVDLEGGLYLDAEALAGAGLRPGQRVRLTRQGDQIVIAPDVVVRLRPGDRSLLDAVL